MAASSLSLELTLAISPTYSRQELPVMASTSTALELGPAMASTSTPLELKPAMASTFSRPLAYRHFLVNKFDPKEQENIEECKTMVPILDHRYVYDDRLPISLTPLVKDEGPWEIKKELTWSDLNGLCRLLLPRKTVEKFIFSYWDVRFVQMLESGLFHVMVEVREYGTRRARILKFKKWTSNNSYVFQGGWSKFAKGMNLEEGDEIGMFWNSKSNYFVFKLLKKHSKAITEGVLIETKKRKLPKKQHSGTMTECQNKTKKAKKEHFETMNIVA